MLKDKRRLTAAVLLSCSFFMAPYYAHAEEEEDVPDCGHGKNYMDISVSNGTNQLTYKFDIYTASTHPGPHWWGEYKEEDDGDPVLDEDGNKVKEYVSYRDLFAGEQEAFGASIGYIHQMVRPAATASTPYINLELLPDEDADAAAESSTYVEKDENGKPKTQISDTELGAVLQGKYLPSGDDPVARIEVNLAPPDTIWYIDKFTALPSNGTDSDYYGTITHEMFHALGLGTYITELSNDNESPSQINFGKNVNYTAPDSASMSQVVFTKYEMGLRDAFGRVAYYEYNSNGNNVYYDRTTGVATTDLKYPINPNEENPLSGVTGELISRNIVPITLAQYNDPGFVKQPDEFYVIRDGSESTNCGAYFTGANVKNVLTTINATTGLAELATIAWPDGSSVPGVIGGIPLNGYEGSDESKPELSHLELQNGLMSHQSYRNWCNFMEVELALLKDLGYNVDLGAYYGKSIYNSGTSTTTFDYTSSANYSSTYTHATGLHIYGSYVNATQNNTITIGTPAGTDGYSGIGIRVDGVNNKLAINSNISVNGQYGNGLLVAYGKEHEVSLESDKTISATGDGGVAARFDFGSNELGDRAGYRGSYINVEYDDKNAKWVKNDLLSALEGPLVSEFNVKGSLNGKLAAIYISPNALVKNINIFDGASITGDIISEWNPDAIFYQNVDGETLAPDLPNGEDGMTNLNFAGDHKGLNEDGSGTDNSFKHNIIGKDSIILNVGTAAASTLDTSRTSVVNIKELNIGSASYNSTFNNKGDLYVDQGMGEITIASGSTLASAGGRIFSQVNDDGAMLQVTGGGNLKLDGATLLLGMKHDFYDGNVELTWTNTNVYIEGSPTAINLFEQSPTLDFTGTLDAANDRYIISMRRNYEQYAYDGGTSSLSNTLVQNAAFLGNNSAHAEDWQKIYEGIDFSNPDGSDVPGMLKQLNPSVYSNSAQATINTHSMLNNMNMLGTFSSLNAPPARTGGGRGPAVNETPKYNAWRNMVMPFTSYTDQHNGNRGYTNHNSGVIGAMERTLENGLTHGYHAALNHQSTSEAGSRIKGEGLYLGTQATYAPADWKGWQVFGSARLGIEQMRSHRNINIGGYSGVADSDWTGYSGSLSVGTALSKEHGIMESGPFAALDYSFAHRPSIHEDGGAISTKISSATYDSLRTQLGYRLTTKPKALDSYDSTKWQAHASVAWNHELLGDNGRTSYQFSDLPGVTISDTVDTYGRDSLSLAAGVTFKTPKRLDVTLTVGSDMYRKGGSSVYGKANFEWKF